MRAGGAAIAAVEVVVNGRRFTPTSERLLAVRVASRLAAPAQCELSFADAQGVAAWPALFSLGATLAVRVQGDDEDLFVGEVTCVEMVRGAGPVASRVRAYDLLHRLRKRQRPRVFSDVTAADLAVTLAADLGVEVVAPEPGPRLDRVVQHRQSDLDLLAAVAAGAGLYPVLRGRTLHLVSLSGHGDPVKLHWGQSLWEARVEANLDRVAGGLTAVGWHPQRAEVMTHRAALARQGRSSALAPDPKAVGVDGEATLVDRPARGPEEVASLAQAALDAGAARAVTLHGAAEGTARLGAGTRIEVYGLDDAVDGGYVVCSAIHSVDGSGYHTSFSTQPPDPPDALSGGASSVTLGRVTAVDDPEGLGRVRVSLPALGDVDAGWLAVLCPGAGAGKGLVVLPDLDDTVVVALPHQSPEAGVVLGSLFGTLAPPDPGVTGGRVRRWTLHTADGQSVVVDDAEHSVRMENRAGSFVELSPDVLRLHAATDLVIDAPGHAMTVRAASIDFEHSPIPIPVPQ